MAEGSRILAFFLEIRLALLACRAKVLVIAANSDSLLVIIGFRTPASVVWEEVLEVVVEVSFDEA